MVVRAPVVSQTTLAVAADQEELRLRTDDRLLFDAELRAVGNQVLAVGGLERRLFSLGAERAAEILAVGVDHRDR